MHVGVYRMTSVRHPLRASPGMRTYSGPLRFNATRSLYVTVRVVAVRLVGRPRHEPVRMIDRLRNMNGFSVDFVAGDRAGLAVN